MFEKPRNQKTVTVPSADTMELKVQESLSRLAVGESLLFGRAYPTSRDFGESDRAYIQVTDHLVSYSHCEITRRVDGFYLSDLGGQAGTSLKRGEQEPQRLGTDPVRLAEGDFVQLGPRVGFRFSNI